MKTKHIICGTLCIIIIFTIGYTGFYVYKLVGNFISYPITLLLKNLKGFYNTAHRLLNQRNISNEKAISKIHQEVNNAISTVVDFNPVNILLSQIVRSLRITS